MVTWEDGNVQPVEVHEWIVSTEEGQPMAGTNFSSAGSVMWLDQGKPWAYFNLEELIYNVDVGEYIRQKGY